MGRQVRFRATEADIKSLENHLKDVGALFIPWLSSSPTIEPQDTLDPPVGLAVDPWIVRRDDLQCLRRYYVEQQRYWVVDSDPCPLVDWQRGRLDGDPMHYGRIHFDATLRKGDEWVPAQPEFIDWADGILRWVRKSFRYDTSRAEYLGPDAARVVGLRLRQ